MTREEKLEVIYAEMANKELMLGCFYLSNVTRQKEIYDGSIGSNYIGEIIGHPVMIGDVLNWIDNKKFNVDDPMIGLFYDPKKMDYETKLFLVQDYLFGRVNGYWRKKRKPIEDQSDECIDYVYSLIPSKSME